jgi:Flp pilus assembly protein TadG
MRLRTRPPRPGVAAIELAFVTMLFMVPLMLAIWETGRLIHVQQVVANAAREGARLAGQGFTIRTDGTQLQIKKDTGSPSVKEAVVNYLRAAGLTTLTDADVTVEFQFAPAPNTAGARTTAYVPIPGVDPAGTSWPAGSRPTEPCWGEKGQEFQVRVSVPWEKVRWTSLGLLRPANVEFTATWRILTDDAFVVNTALPRW